MPHVTGIVGYAQTQDPRFISTAGDAAYVVVQLDMTDEASVDAVDGIRAAIVPPAGYTYQLTGYGPITKDSAEQSEKDLQKAELVSLPVVAIVLVLVFASLAAAGMPLLVAGLAIPSSLALVYLVAQRIEMSIFVLNIATMLGLALAIDYSLFIVSRYREELRRGRSVGDAVERAVATAGKAVAFSGLAVAIGLSGLLLFVAPAIRSIGIAGALVVLCSVVFSLTFLPAVLGMLGHRVNALSISGLRHRFRPVADGVEVARTGRWERVAHGVMRRPVAVLIPTLLFLLILGAPFLRLVQGVPGRRDLPGRRREPRRVHRPPDRVRSRRDDADHHPRRRGRLTDEPRQHPGARRVRRAGGCARGHRPGREPVRHPRSGDRSAPQPGAGGPALCAARRPAPAGCRRAPRAVRPRLHGPPRRDQPAAAVATRGDRPHPADPGASSPAAGITTTVGGSAAIGHDFLVSQAERAPYAVGLTLFASGAILFLLFGSVVLPLKAVLMTLLSITASFGAMVWIFQEGHLSGLLNFTPLGYTIAGNPIIMFSVIFGLSMDYEVLLLSRIQEAWRRTGDNTASVAEGLAKTAGVITGAALIMVSVFAAFALADVITIKSIGVGMAIAVFVDATIIRVLLVPATMRLMGRWNWWAPGILGRFVDRLGFSHVEDDEEPVAPAPGAAPRMAGS